jgi:3-oxosteroid 1-dehydrogenase
MNECGSYMEFCQRMLARDKVVPAIPSWMILDTRFLKDYMLGNTMPGVAKPQQWFDANYLRRGDTIEALAEACKIDPATLRATTERFNGFAIRGVDEDFHRGERAYDRFLGDYTHKPVSTLDGLIPAPAAASAHRSLGAMSPPSTH